MSARPDPFARPREDLRGRSLCVDVSRIELHARRARRQEVLEIVVDRGRFGEQLERATILRIALDEQLRCEMSRLEVSIGEATANHRFDAGAIAFFACESGELVGGEQRCWI